MAKYNEYQIYEWEIEDIIKQGEDEYTEFKKFNSTNDKSTPRKVAEAISSFWNTTRGGRIIIGINDDRTIGGIDKNELPRVMEKLDQILNDSIMPQTCMDNIHFGNVYMSNEDKYLIVVNVPSDESYLCYS
ncbi:MAG: AlbA family DNA-binding domain-containing protein [Candidatus Hodarchaeales archaeon]